MQTGCTNHGLAMRDTGPHFGGKTTRSTDRLSDREDYINSNYRMQLATGRASNEEEARALASSDWERMRHRGKLETE